MLFGLFNTPSTFQGLMKPCLGELLLTWCITSLDDILVFSQSPEELLTRLNDAFYKLRAAGMKLKPSKCELFRKEINYLGNAISS